MSLCESTPEIYFSFETSSRCSEYTFAGQGEMKKMPMSSAGIPFSSACFLASFAAIFAGAYTGSR